MESISGTVLEWLQMAAHDPLLLAFGLAVATLATEDGALVAGSLLVGSGAASPLLVIAALAFGITVGDIGLYGVGWSARTNKFLRKRLPVKKSRPLRRWLQTREATILFASRFTPGTRFITYVTFGFLKLSLVRFSIVMTISGLLWVGSMVLFVSEIQQALSHFGAGTALSLALLTAVTFIILMPRLIKKFSTIKSIKDVEGDIKHA